MICYTFVWQTLAELVPFAKRYLKGSHVETSSIKQFEYLFSAVSVPFPPIFSSGLKILITYKQFINLYKYKYSPVIKGDEGLYIYSQKATSFVAGGNTFHCGDGVYISMIYICDGVDDCPGNSKEDEKHCLCDRNKLLPPCKYIIDNGENKSCSLFYTITADGSCSLSGPSLKGTTTTSQNNSLGKFTCQDGSDIDNILVNDLISDCGPDGDDEYHYKAMVKFKNIYDCPLKSQLPCYKGHSKCYDISDICVYRLDIFNNLTPCRTGSHLENCTNFECNAMFKCIKHYCIPWSYVCDGKWDCHQGYDESFCWPKKECTNLFKCRASEICIHLENVCDNFIDCPLEEDEKYCGLKHTTCPSICQCLLYTIICDNVTIVRELIEKVFVFNIIFIRSSFANNVPLNYLRVSNVKSLVFIKSGLKYACSIIGKFSHLLQIDFSFNDIKTVEPYCFNSTEKVEMIYLKHNKIYAVCKFAFHNLVSLKILSLASNDLSSFLKLSFAGPEMLKDLSLTGNSLLNLKISSIESLKVKYIDAEQYEICCIVPKHTICSSVTPMSVSCSSLSKAKKHNWIIIFVSFLILIFNTLSIVVHIISKRKRHYKTMAFYYIVISLHIVDLTYCLYLFILWISVSFYKDDHVMKSIMWKSENICYLAYALLLNYNVLFPMLVHYMAFSRYLVVIYPLKSAFKRTPLTFVSLFLQYSVAVIITGFVTLLKRKQSIAMDNSFCSPFIYVGQNDVFTKFLTPFVALFQIICLISIIAIYMNIKRSLQNHMVKIESSFGNQQGKMTLISQIMILNISICCCWIPINTINMLNLIMETYSFQLLYWALVAIQPLNSIVYPIVFILTAFKKN